MSLLHSPGHPAADVRIENNLFTSFENALSIGLAGALGADYAAAINNNVFDFPMTAAPARAYIRTIPCPRDVVPWGKSPSARMRL